MATHAPPNTLMHSKGIWLPLGSSNFFNPEKDRPEKNRLDRDRALIFNYNGNDDLRPKELHGYLLGKEVRVPRKRLQSSSFYRLVSVVGGDFDRELAGFGPETFTGKRYSHVFPLFEESWKPREPRPDPVGVIFTCDDKESPEWSEIRSFLIGIVLAVRSNGFYVWTVLYSDVDPIGKDPDDVQKERDRQYVLVDKALDAHMELMIGKGFFSHYAERQEKSSKRLAEENVRIPEYERSPSLKTYREEDIGILNFFQLNVLLEGLYNYNFDPRVFFDDGSSEESAKSVRQEYSLDNFMYLARKEVTKMLRGSIVDDFYILIKEPETLIDTAGLNMLLQLHKDCFNPGLRYELLRQFFRKTSTSILHLMQLRIESCTRALLGVMIEVAHLRYTLLQINVPDTTSDDKNEATQNRYVIDNANEGQLRGYIMLFAAKIPLLLSTANYLKNNLEALAELDMRHKTTYREEMRSIERSWFALLSAIQENIKGLENAIEQAYMNQMLDETGKLRSEQENIAEIERIRERTGTSFSPSSNIAVSVIANVIALSGLAIAITLGGKQLIGSVPFLQNIESQGPIIAFLSLISALLLLTILYTSLQGAFNASIRIIARLFTFRRRRREERYYYEMDLGLNAVLGQKQALKLLAGDFPKFTSDSGILAIWDEVPKRERPFVERNFLRKPERSSFRLNRSSRDQSLFKIYVDAYVIWPRRWLPNGIRNFFTKQHMRIFLVYEILFHTPSGTHEYKIRSVRVVSNTNNILDSPRLVQLRALVADEFVNRWIERAQDRITIDDALLELNPAQMGPSDQSVEAHMASDNEAIGIEDESPDAIERSATNKDAAGNSPTLPRKRRRPS